MTVAAELLVFLPDRALDSAVLVSELTSMGPGTGSCRASTAS